MTLDFEAKCYIDWDNDGSFDGPSSANRITNGDFADGETGWTFVDGIQHSVSGGKLNVYRNGGSAAAFYQEFTYTTSVSDEFTVSFKIANTSAGDKVISVLVQNAGGTTTWHTEPYTILAGAGETTKTFTATATSASTGVRFVVFITTDDNDPALTFDDVSVTTTHDKDDVSAYLQDVAITLGLASVSKTDRVAAVGTCSLTFKNDDKRFSPSNAAGPYYGKLLPRRPIRVDAVADGLTKTTFRGSLLSIEPEPDQYGNLNARIECEDRIGELQAARIALPIALDRTTDDVLGWITSEAYKSAVATGSITFADVPADGDQVIIGDITYTFRNTLLAAYEVAIGATAAASASNLNAAINLLGVAGTTYDDATKRHPEVTSTVSGAVIALKAVARGAWANSIALATQRSEIVASNFSAVVGSVASGALSDTYTENGVDLVLNETAAAPAFNYEFGFNVGAGNQPTAIKLYGYYSGNAMHDVNVDCESPTSPGTWFTLGHFLDGAGDALYTWTGNQLVAGALGAVKIRFYHVSMGNASHDVYIDHLYLTVDSPVAIATISVSGAALSGGVTGPSGEVNFQTGDVTLDYAGEKWNADDTNGLTAAADVTETEIGVWLADRNGTFRFYNRSWEFLLYTVTPALVIDDDHNIQANRVSLDDVYTRVSVTYTPRVETTTQIVASSDKPIKVPGNRSTTTRYNRTEDLTTGSTAKTVSLEFKQPNTDNRIGALDLVLPLEPGTDYTITRRKDGTGADLSGNGDELISVAQAGSRADVTIANTTDRTFNVQNLRIRGIGLQFFDPTVIVLDDTDAQAIYGRRELSYTLPLSFDEADAIAEALAQHFLNDNKTPRDRVTNIGFDGPITVNGVNVYSLELGNVLQVSETQTGLVNNLFWICGIEYQFAASTRPRVVFLVRRVDDTPYWVLEDSASQLGTNTYLGV